MLDHIDKGWAQCAHPPVCYSCGNGRLWLAGGSVKGNLIMDDWGLDSNKPRGYRMMSWPQLQREVARKRRQLIERLTGNPWYMQARSYDDEWRRARD